MSRRRTLTRPPAFGITERRRAAGQLRPGGVDAGQSSCVQAESLRGGRPRRMQRAAGSARSGAMSSLAPSESEVAAPPKGRRRRGEPALRRRRFVGRRWPFARRVVAALASTEHVSNFDRLKSASERRIDGCRSV